MIAKCAQVTATVNIELDERELLILHHICSYDLSGIGQVSSYCDTPLAKSIQKDELKKTVEHIREITLQLMKHIDRTKIFSKQEG